MVKQLGIPTCFLALSCANLRWDELPYIINRPYKTGLSGEGLKNLSLIKNVVNFLMIITYHNAMV